jgi:hypothetical protein
MSISQEWISRCVIVAHTRTARHRNLGPSFAAGWSDVALRIFTGARGSKFVCDDDGGFGDTVAAISQRADAPISSCAREQAAEPFLHQLGKMSQQQLYDCYQAKLKTGRCPDECHGNCRAANKPGKSTHERFNDGRAYAWWPPFFRLPVWARGIDVQIDRLPAFCDEARREGFTVALTYPGVADEVQHVNFRKQPKIDLWSIRPLREGMSGPRVQVHPNGKFTPQVAAAVKAFQLDHHQPANAVVDVHTIRALRGARRTQQAEEASKR